jgi:hypothetical protein
MDEPIESAYFNWLCAKVTVPEGRAPSQTYWKLLQELQNTEFTWTLDAPMDENRAEDGLDLRVEFCDTTRCDPDPSWGHIGCSILEMLIAFSRRASFVTDRRSRDWFWEFLKNLGIDHLSDAVFDGYNITDILDCFVWRTYDYNGQGGLFPLHDPHDDQRKVEIWYQFCEYLVEHNIS